VRKKQKNESIHEHEGNMVHVNNGQGTHHVYGWIGTVGTVCFCELSYSDVNGTANIRFI
jgi:hypothetical protein